MDLSQGTGDLTPFQSRFIRVSTQRDVLVLLKAQTTIPKELAAKVTQGDCVRLVRAATLGVHSTSVGNVLLFMPTSSFSLGWWSSSSSCL